MNSLELLQKLVSLPGPSGEEDRVRSFLQERVKTLGLTSTVDGKGNLFVKLGDSEKPPIMVCAHMDEIAMMVTNIHMDGSLAVKSLGGLHPWKLGEGPVEILADTQILPGVLSFGGVHTEAPGVPTTSESMLDWDGAQVLTGLAAEELFDYGVRPGTRVVVAQNRRTLTHLGELVSGYFLDDRADLVSWLFALEALKNEDVSCLFVATAAEEVGGEGALYAMNNWRPEVCIALELGPNVPDAPVEISENPTVWVTDSYSTMAAKDIRLVAELGAELGLELQFQALSRGGSDASCSASHGLCARPFTLGLPMDNSHGYEIIHPESIMNLARLTASLVHKLSTEFAAKR